MKKKRIISILGIVVILTLLTSLFVGCGKKDPPAEDIAPTYIDVPSTQVAYNSSGAYTTTVKADCTGIAKEDIAVVYEYFDKAGYQNALKSSSESVDMTKYYTIKKAKIGEVKFNDDKSMTVSFTDEDAFTNKAQYYDLSVVKRSMISEVEVAFKECTLETETTSVNSGDKALHLSLALKGSTFKPNIVKDDIVLSGSFANLTIASISNSDNNLTMQLTGDIAYSEEGRCYEAGIVSVSPSAVLDAKQINSIYIDIDSNNVVFDSENLGFNDGVATLPVSVGNVVDATTLKRSDVAFEHDVNVTGIVNGKENIILLLDVNGATDKNSAAKILDGQKVSFGDVECYVGLSAASFYPVFDFIKKDGDNFLLTIKLYANAGKFGAELTTDNVTLLSDFASGSVQSIVKESDTVAELVIRLPHNGANISDFDVTGEISLAANSLINRWGAPSDATSYSRKFSEKSLGKDLTDTDISSIKDIVGGFGNTTFGTIKDVASGLSTAYSVVQTAMEFLGYSESDADRNYHLMQDMQRELSSKLDEQMEVLQNVAKNVSKLTIADYNRKVSYLQTSNDICNAFFKTAMNELASKGIKPPAKKITTSDKSKADASLVREWTKYESTVRDYIHEQAKAGNAEFSGFDAAFAKLKDNFTMVADMVGLKQAKDGFNELCRLTFTMDTIAYDTRILFYSNINNALTDGMKSILLFDGNIAVNKTYNDKYVAARKVIDEEIKNSKSEEDCEWFLGKYPYVYGAKNQATEGKTYDYAQLGYSNGFNMLELPNNFAEKLHYDTLEDEFYHSGMLVGKMGCNGIALRYTHKQKKEICWETSAFWCYYRYYYYDIMDWNGNISNVAVYKRASSSDSSSIKSLGDYTVIGVK